MTEHKVSFRYAKAAIETAEKENLTDQLLIDLKYIRKNLLSSNELKTFIKSPVVTENNKKKLFNELFAEKVDHTTLNFVLFIIEKGRGAILIDIINNFEEQYNLLNGRIKVEINTAIELTEEMKKKIIDKITDYTKMEVLPEFNIQHSLKGGLLVKVEDWVFDATLKRQLDNLYYSLSEN